MSGIEQDIIILQIHREITSLFKSYLSLLEELDLNKEKQDILRKKTLDYGNDTIRSLTEFINYFDFKINEEKLKEALQKKTIIKKCIVNGTSFLE